MGNDRVQKNIEGLYADARTARNINSRNLAEILSANAGTTIGKKFGFSSMHSEGDFLQGFPLSDYSDYKDLLSLMFNEKKEGVLTRERPYCFFYTSGSMGNRKVVPFTMTSLERYSTYVTDMPFYLTGARGGVSLHASAFAPTDSKGGLLLSSAYFTYHKGSGRLEGSFVGGETFNFAQPAWSVPYAKLRLALATPGLLSIQSIFLYDALLIFGYLKGHWEAILRDMRDGTVSVDMPRDAADELRRLSATSRERLDIIEDILKEGFSAPIVPRLWPSLRFVSGIGDDASWQTAALKKYTGGIPISYFAYASSEVMAGVPTKMNESEYLLLPRSAYYEFLPEGADKPLPLSCVQEGGEYELVATTFSGLYRYRTGDLMRITGFCGEAPLFRLCGRVGQRLNIAGEKVDAQTLSGAIGELQAAGTDVHDFAVAALPRRTPGRYVFFIEAEGSEEEIAASLDGILSRLSYDYAELRGLAMLDPPLVHLMERLSIDAVLHGNSIGHKKAAIIIGEEGYNKLKTHYDEGKQKEKRG